LKQILKYQSYRINESMKNKEKENLKLEDFCSYVFNRDESIIFQMLTIELSDQNFIYQANKGN